MAASTTKEVFTDLSPVLKVYTDGTVERLFGSPLVPPSPEDPATGVSSKDAIISPSISARLYLPKSTADDPSQKLPILVYYHGGGFCIGSAFSSTEHLYMNMLSAMAEALIVSVEYRLAPEHPLPTAYDDSWDALKWVVGAQTDQWISDHGDFARLCIAGDSAGANIAHHMALRAGSDPLPVKIRGTILSHPYFLGSDIESGENSNLRLLERIWSFVYPSAAGGIDSPWINPIVHGAPSLTGLGCSRIQICVAEMDVLTDRARAYAEKLKNCGWKGDVEVVDVEGEDHCFHILDPQTSKAKNLIAKLALFISQ